CPRGVTPHAKKARPSILVAVAGPRPKNAGGGLDAVTPAVQASLATERANAGEADAGTAMGVTITASTGPARMAASASLPHFSRAAVPVLFRGLAILATTAPLPRRQLIWAL